MSMKPVRVEVAARRHRGAVAQHQVLLHLRPAQVEHAVLEAHGLGQVLVVELERRRQRRVEDLDLVREHLDLAGHEVRVDRAFGARPHEAGHARCTNSLRSVLGGRERRGAVRVADDLHQAFAVAQVDEDDAAVVAAAMDPAHQRDGLAEVAAVDAAAVVGAFQGVLREGDAYGRGGDGGAGRPSRAGPPCAAARATLPGQFRDAGGRVGDARRVAASGGRPGGARARAARRRPSR